MYPSNVATLNLCCDGAPHGRAAPHGRVNVAACPILINVPGADEKMRFPSTYIAPTFESAVPRFLTVIWADPSAEKAIISIARFSGAFGGGGCSVPINPAE